MMKLWNCIRKSAPDCGKADHDVQESCHTRKAYCEECVRGCGGSDENGVKKQSNCKRNVNMMNIFNVKLPNFQVRSIFKLPKKRIRNPGFV